MKNHDELKADLQDYLENQLADRDRRDMDDHLITCATCREELNEFKELFQDLDQLPVLQPAVDMSSSVMSRIQATTVRQPIQVPVKQWLPVLGYGYLLGFLVIAVTSYWGYNNYQGMQFSLTAFNAQLIKHAVFTITFMADLMKWTGELGTLFYESLILLAGGCYWYIRKRNTKHYMFV
jgi:predicted anti-sigma-YlaC factor YlaD